MRDEIRHYLDEHGTTYTPDALRGGLLTAGFDAAEVDAALQEWTSERARAAGGKDDRRNFGKWSLLIYLGALVVVFALTVLLNGTETGLAIIGAVVLGFFLLVAWGASTLLGHLLVPRVGLGFALLVPLVFALGLGGTCLAIMDGMTPTPPTPGTVELRHRSAIELQRIRGGGLLRRAGWESVEHQRGRRGHRRGQDSRHIAHRLPGHRGSERGIKHSRTAAWP